MQQTGPDALALTTDSTRTPFNHVLDVQDGAIDLSAMFHHIDRGLGLITQEETENGKTG
jgi:hypothetical protein